MLVNLKAVAYEGKVYALPYIGYYEGLLVNKDLFKKFNVKIPTNFIELRKAVEVFNKNKITPIANSFVDPRYLLEYSILSAGGVPQIKCRIPSVTVATKSGWTMENAAHSLNSPIDSFLAYFMVNYDLCSIVMGAK